VPSYVSSITGIGCDAGVVRPRPPTCAANARFALSKLAADRMSRGGGSHCDRCDRRWRWARLTRSATWTARVAGCETSGCHRWEKNVRFTQIPPASPGANRAWQGSASDWRRASRLVPSMAERALESLRTDNEALMEVLKHQKEVNEALARDLGKGPRGGTPIHQRLAPYPRRKASPCPATRLQSARKGRSRA